jgi:hypothetical protein
MADILGFHIKNIWFEIHVRFIYAVNKNKIPIGQRSFGHILWSGFVEQCSTNPFKSPNIQTDKC